MLWRVAAAALLALFTGCLFPDLTALTPVDASADAPDADAGLPKLCDPLGKFTTILPLTGLSSPTIDELQPTLSDDELEIWFTTQTADGGTFRISSAKRVAPTDSFGAPALDTNVDAVGDNVDPAISGDALTIVFPRSPSIVGGFDLYRATRTSRTAGFDPPAALANVQSTTDEISPFIAHDGTLYFASKRAGNFDIYEAQLQGTGYASPVLLSALSSPNNDTGIIVSYDGLVAYVASERSDLSLGGTDIFRATRATTADAFGALQAVAELESPQNDRAHFISADGCRIYFESARNGGFGGDLFVASRVP